MSLENKTLIISKLNGFAGIRLLNNQPLEIKNGINLLVGRNGSGKSNLINLIEYITTEHGEIKRGIESSYFSKYLKNQKRSKPSISLSKAIITQFSFNSKTTKVSFQLPSEMNETVLRNIKDGARGFQDNLIFNKPKFKSSWSRVNNNDSIRKMEFSGQPLNSIFYRPLDKDLTNLFVGPVEVVNEFVRKKLHEFFTSSEFSNKMKQLEDSMNNILYKFLGTTKKKIKLSYDLNANSDISLLLMDGDNRIEPQLMSRGENVLLNLIFSLITARANSYDFMIFDEPELHMHDDMVKVFVDEIQTLSESIPKCTIIIATHSTALIEQLANHEGSVNLILFDSDRNVYNSNNDIDFVKALKRNGVWFTPLMLSKKKNIFIENLGKKGIKHQEFYKKFFHPEDSPNVISIGTGGNVINSDYFLEIFNDLIQVESSASVGIRDGDLWFKNQLIDYLKGNKELDNLLKSIPSDEKLYIASDSSSHQFFFNLWEIENLYLQDEMISCWTSANENLSKKKFKSILKANKRKIARIYLHTFFKAISNARFDSPNSIENDLEKLGSLHLEIKKISSNFHLIESRSLDLIDSFLSNDLIRWLPGKEIKQLLENNNYTFNDSKFDHYNSNVGLKLRKI